MAARAAVTITKLTGDASNTPVEGNALDPATGHVITPTSRYGELLIEVVNTTAAEKAVTILAGDKPIAAGAGAGDLVLTLGAGDVTPTVSQLVLTSNRFSQDDGTILIDAAANTTGFIRCYQLPKGA